MLLEEGSHFGRYIVGVRIGHGGTGDVYRAHDALVGRDVALKVLHLDAPAEEQPALGALLLREARAAAALDHPNVVSIFDVGEHEGRAYIAMELVVGRSLRTILAGAELPSLELRVAWLGDVAKALAAAHAKGIVHSDVKPENVRAADALPHLRRAVASCDSRFVRERLWSGLGAGARAPANGRFARFVRRVP
jgi:serine/threonine-protein kinase